MLTHSKTLLPLEQEQETLPASVLRKRSAVTEKGQITAKAIYHWGVGQAGNSGAHDPALTAKSSTGNRRLKSKAESSCHWGRDRSAGEVLLLRLRPSEPAED